MTTTYNQEDMISFANYCKHYGSLNIGIVQFNSWKDREEKLSKIINNEFQKQEWENSLPSDLSPDYLEKKERILKKMKEAGGKAGEKLKGTVGIIPQEKMDETLNGSMGISEEMKNTLLELQKKYSPGFTPFKGFDK